MRPGAGVRTGAAGAPRPLGAHGRPPLSGTGCAGTRNERGVCVRPIRVEPGSARLWPTEAGSAVSGEGASVSCKRLRRDIEASSSGIRRRVSVPGVLTLLSGTEGDLGPPGGTLAVAANFKLLARADLADSRFFTGSRSTPAPRSGWRLHRPRLRRRHRRNQRGRRRRAHLPGRDPRWHRRRSGKRHPTIGDRVVIGTGAKILGNFTVGDNCRSAPAA